MSRQEEQKEYLAIVSERFSEGFPALVGFEFLAWQEGQVVLGLTMTPEHLNLGGTVHGGVLATLIDVAGACAGTFSPDPQVLRKALTLSMTTTFTGQCKSGQITAVGTLKAAGRRIYFSSVEVFDEQNNLIAMGEGTFRYR